MARRIDDDNLDVTPDSVLVLQNIGPVGNPGMPEAGLSTHSQVFPLFSRVAIVLALTCMHAINTSRTPDFKPIVYIL